ncbi:hypothetical protein D9M72_522970 [compost metagenome]
MNNNEFANRLPTLSSCALAAAFFFVAAAASAQTASVSSGSGQGGTAPSHASAVTSAPHAEPALHPQPSQDTPATEENEEAFNLPLQVGDATSSLFAWQRSGEIASPTARPIAGGVAGRSYERYLKSFEFPIPERMNSTVKASNGGGSTR